MANRIQLRRDTYQNWYNNNPILFEGEIALDLTNRKIKIGDGTSHWRDLLNSNVTPEELASSNPSELGIAIDQNGNLVLSNDNAIILNPYGQIYNGGISNDNLMAKMSWVDNVSAGTGINISYLTRNYATGPNKQISIANTVALKTDIPGYLAGNGIRINPATGNNSYISLSPEIYLPITSFYGNIQLQNVYGGNLQNTVTINNEGNITLRPYGPYNQSYDSRISAGFYGGLELYTSDGSIYLTSGDTAYLNGEIIATRPYVESSINNLINSAPSTLNTLKELSDALASDPNFATTITNLIGTKIATSQRGVANGVASLDSAGQVPATQLGNASGGSTAIHSFAMIG